MELRQRKGSWPLKHYETRPTRLTHDKWLHNHSSVKFIATQGNLSDESSA